MITTSNNLVGYKSVILNISMDSKMALLEHGNSMSWKPRTVFSADAPDTEAGWSVLDTVSSCS